MTTEFIKKAISVHGEEYDYSNVEYLNAKTKIIVICKKHGKFEVTPNKHLSRGDGCKNCGKERARDKQRKTTEDFVKEAKLKHIDNNGNPIYCYEKVAYINSKTPVLITCKKHDNF